MLLSPSRKLIGAVEVKVESVKDVSGSLLAPSGNSIQIREPSFEIRNTVWFFATKRTWWSTGRLFLPVVTLQILHCLSPSTSLLSYSKIKVIKLRSCSTHSYPFFQCSTIIKTEKLVRPRLARSRQRVLSSPDTSHPTSYHILP